MTPAKRNGLLSWCERPNALRAALVVLLAMAAAEGYLAICVRENDFQCHRQNGEAFLAGDPYGPGEVAREVYPVARTMINGALAVGPLLPTRAVCYVLALCALCACYHAWRRLAEWHIPAGERAAQVAALATLLLAFPFVLRDLDECGLQLFLLLFLSAAGLALATRRLGWAGFWLATAAVYKVTPFLFFPLLLWKRQWRAAGWMVGFVVLWFLAPAVFLGWEVTLASHGKWLARSVKIASASQAYPSQLELEEPKVYNLSCAALVARYLESHSPDHSLYIEHPGFVQFGGLEPLTAYYVTRGVMLMLALMLAWRLRLPWTGAEGQGSAFAPEWAAACLLCALMAPVCWKQHLVVMLPALFLSVRFALVHPGESRWRFVALAVAGVLFLGSKRFVLGTDWSLLALSYKVDTVGVLLLLATVLTLVPRRAVSRSQSESNHRPWLAAATG